MVEVRLEGTDTTKFRLIAEIEVWRDERGHFDLWFDNAIYHCAGKKDMMDKLSALINSH